jgi:hypothetical protein
MQRRFLAGEIREKLFGREGHERHDACALNGPAQGALMSCAIARYPAWDDLSPIGRVVLELLDVLVIDVRGWNLVGAKATDFSSFECLFFCCDH